MNKHTVFVAGKRFILLSDDKEEYVVKLAEEVSDTITKISSENPTLDRRSAALLCALDYADDVYKEKIRNKSLSDKAQPFIAQADKQAKQIRELKEMLQKKDDEIEQLSKTVKQLEEKLDNIPRVLDGQGMVKEVPVEETSCAEPETADTKSETEPKAEKPVGRKKKKKNKGYKPMRQFSLFDDEEN